jgi:hypothetical protein
MSANDLHRYGCHNRDTQAARERPLVVQQGWNQNGTRRMGAHQPQWDNVDCGHNLRATDPACTGCKWRDAE